MHDRKRRIAHLTLSLATIVSKYCLSRVYLVLKWFDLNQFKYQGLLSYLYLFCFCAIVQRFFYNKNFIWKVRWNIFSKNWIIFESLYA